MTTVMPYKDKLMNEPILLEDDSCLYMISTDGICRLRLPDGEQRTIGFLTKDREGVVEYHITRNPDIHLMTKFNAYGINYRIMEAFDPDRVIFYIINPGTDSKNIYYIDRVTYRKHASFLYFKKQGFEVQKFIEVAHLKTHYPATVKAKSII